MFKNKKTILVVCFAVIIVGTVGIRINIPSSEEKTSSKQNTQILQQVESKYVCMVTNKLFNKEQIPVEVKGKTYYGCCEMCKGTLANDPNSRVAVDPVSGKPVDKALSVTASSSDGSIYYFENEKNLREFNNKIGGEN